jgi:hypothetical protein
MASTSKRIIEVIVASLPEGYSVDVIRRDEDGVILAATEVMPASTFGMDLGAARKWARAYAQTNSYLFEPETP